MVKYPLLPVMGGVAKAMQEQRKKREAIFPPLEKLAKEFVKKNHLKEPEIIEDNTGLMLIFTKNSALHLSCETKSRHSDNRNAIIGGSGYATEQVVEYTLSGRHEGREIELEAQVTETQRYKTVQDDNVYGCHHMNKTKRIEDGEPEVYKSRKDDSRDYWFVINVS